MYTALPAINSGKANRRHSSVEARIEEYVVVGQEDDNSEGGNNDGSGNKI